MESSSSSNKRSRSHRDSCKREKQASNREHSARKQPPKFGELIPRKSSSDELRQFANNVLGDYHSTVETIAKDQSRLMGVDRSLPITPIPGKNPVNIFDQTMKERLEKQTKMTDPSQHKSSRHLEQTLSSGSKSSKKNGDDIRHPLSSSSTLSHQSLKPHPQPHLSTKDTDSIASPIKHSKKPKKSRHFVPTDETSSHDEIKPSLASSGKSLSVSSNYPFTSHSFKRTNSLDDKQLVMETTQSFDHTQFGSQPNEKMSVDIKKKDKRPKKSKKERPRESGFVTSDHVISNTSHVTTSTGHMIPPSSRSSSRPSQLTVETTSIESNDVQSMLKEMTLPPSLTPIHTPCKKPEFPFLFPSGPQSTTNRATFDETMEKPDFNNTSSDEEEIDNNPSTHKISLTTPSSLHDSKSLSLPPLTSTTDILGNISSSDDSSSESEDSSGEEEEEEGEINDEVEKSTEENTRFILEQIKNEFNAPLLDTLTPIKTSPPGRGQHPLSLVSPLIADESANLSPAKPYSHNIIKQDSRHIKMDTNSLGFSIDNSKSGATTPFTPLTNFQPKAEPMTSDSDSSSSEEESDSESSDSEDEDKTESNTSNPQNRNEDVTQPFHVSNNVTTRQISKPFLFEPDDISPSTDSAKLPSEPEGTHIGPKPVPSREQTIKSTSFIVSQHQSSKKRRRNSERDPSRHSTQTPYTDKLQLSDVSIEPFTEREDSEIEVSDRRDLKTFIVQIPFSKVPDLLQQQKIKPQATVNPYNISSNRKRSGNEEDNNLGQVLPPARRERRYDRQEETEVSYQGDGYRGDMRSHRDRRGWSVEFDPRNSSRRDRCRDRDGDGDRWEREQYTSTPLSDHNNEDYWSYHNTHHSYESSRREEPRDRTQYTERNRTNSSEYFYERAKILKHEADSLPQTQGISKAIRYMQSVVYFIRHGHSQESEVKSDCKDASNNKSKAYKIYYDIISMVKYCIKLGADCKPLIIICLRCQAALMWRMYLLKQSSLLQLHKFHQKSPNPAGSFSPLPSPASVGSTASSCSGPCSASNSAPSQEPTGSTSVSKAVCSKVTEYLTLTGYVHQGQELWKQADILMGQYRDVFNNVNRRIGVVYQYSPIAHVAEWVENGLQSIARNP